MLRTTLLFISILLMGCSSPEANTSDEETASGMTPSEADAYTLSRNKTRFLWREQVYDASLQDSVSTIMINERLVEELTDAERAALGYVATFIGSECDWDGKANTDFSNLACKTLSALKLGYQCSNQHLGFLRHWFRNDQAVLSQLDACPIVPFTASNQQTFDAIYLTTQGDTIEVWFSASGMNMPMNAAWEWTEENTFLKKKDAIRLVGAHQSEVIRSELGLSEGL